MDFIMSIPGRIADFFHIIPSFPQWLRYCIYAWILSGVCVLFISYIWYILPTAAPTRVQSLVKNQYGTIQGLDIRSKSLEELKQIVYDFQKQALDFMDKGFYTQAGEALATAEPYLNEAILRNPQDLRVLNLRGYMFKDWAQVNIYSGQRSEAEKMLDEAMKTFQLILKMDKNDAGAHNGLGSVYALRGDYKKAEKEILKALEINPNYEAAKHDLKLVRSLLKEAEELKSTPK